jgi:hypothetical protein
MIQNSLMIPAAVILAALQGSISLVAQTGSPAAPLQQAASGTCDAETDRFCGVRENADRFRAVYEKLENDTMAEIDAMMRTRRCQDKRVGGLLDRLVDSLDQWNKQEINYWSLWGDAEALRVEGQEKSLAGMEADQKRAEELIGSITKDREKLLRDKGDIEKFGQRSAAIVKKIDEMVLDIKESEGRLTEANKNYEDVSVKVRNMKASINVRLVEIRQNQRRVEAYGLEMRAYYDKTRAAAQEMCNAKQPDAIKTPLPAHKTVK